MAKTWSAEEAGLDQLINHTIDTYLQMAFKC